MAYSNRTIVYTLLLSVMLAYCSLFVLILHRVHTNGWSNANFIVYTGGDGFHYVQLANNLLHNGRFAVSATSNPEYFRTPAYPLFIALLLAVTKNIAVLPVVQFFLAACSAAFTFLLGARFCGRKVGLAAAILFAIEPAVLTNALISATDTLFVTILLWATYVLVMPREFNIRKIFLAGVLMGILTLVRPIGLYVIPLYFVWLLWESRHDWKRAGKITGVFLIGVVVVVGPWVGRNYAYSGHAAVSSTGVYTLLFYNIADFEHERTGVSKDSINKKIMEQVGVKEMDDPSSLKFADREKSVALSYLVAHPFKYATFHLLSTIPFYIGSSIDTAERAVYLRGIAKDSPPPNVNITTAMAPADVNVSHLILTGHIQEGLRALTDNFPVLLERLLWFILCIASLGAVLRGIYRCVEGVSVAVLFFGVIVAFGILTGPVAYSRYRMPIDSFIFILGISGIVLLLHPLYTRARLYL